MASRKAKFCCPICNGAYNASTSLIEHFITHENASKRRIENLEATIRDRINEQNEQNKKINEQERQINEQIKKINEQERQINEQNAIAEIKPAMVSSLKFLVREFGKLYMEGQRDGWFSKYVSR